MELKSSPALPSTRRNSFQGAASSNPFGPTFSDPLCSLHLKETSEFVRAFPMARSNSSNGHGYHNDTTTTSSSSASAQRRRLDQQQQQGPGTPGRPLLLLTSSSSTSRRCVPSKWEDAEKWLRQSATDDHHHHGRPCRQNNGGGEEKRKPPSGRSSVEAEAAVQALYVATPAEVLLKDKFTDNVEPSKETFVFRSAYCEPAKVDAAAGDGDRRDVGTEMTPLGSSSTSRCHTPIKSASPARHNTPASRSGPLVPYNGDGLDISELTDCHFAKLDLGAQFDSMLVNWSSKEEEEEEVSKSLRHFDGAGGGGGGSACEKRGVAECRWEEEERTKSCMRYQREEAKIQAWVNLESAKAEAQSRKLEVKIQKMRSNLEEKLMRRMSSVHRRAEEWRAGAQVQHLQQLKRAVEHARRLKSSSHNLSGGNASCGCFPCNSSSIVSSNLLNYYY